MILDMYSIYAIIRVLDKRTLKEFIHRFFTSFWSVQKAPRRPVSLLAKKTSRRSLGLKIIRADEAAIPSQYGASRESGWLREETVMVILSDGSVISWTEWLEIRGT